MLQDNHRHQEFFEFFVPEFARCFIIKRHAVPFLFHRIIYDAISFRFKMNGLYCDSLPCNIRVQKFESGERAIIRYYLRGYRICSQ